MTLVFEGITWAATAGSRGVATLDHEIGNYAMKGNFVIVALFCEVEKIRYGHRCLGRKKGSLNVSLAGLYDDTNVRHIFRVGRG